MKLVYAFSFLLVSSTSFAQSKITCYQDCPEGQICASPGFSFRMVGTSSVGDVTGVNGEIISYRVNGSELKVKLNSDMGPHRKFSVDLDRLGQEGPTGRVSMLGLFRYNVFCE